MNINVTLKSLAIAAFMGSTTLFAQSAPAAAPTDTAKKPEAPLMFMGHACVYYRYSSNNSPSLTSYTKAVNNSSLGLANLQVSKDNGNVGFMMDMMFGPRAEETNYNYTGSQVALKQLYVTYKPTPKLMLTAGSFLTFFSYELVESCNNLNYSMSYTFTNGPFYHTGLKAEYALSDKWSLLVGVFNRTDFKMDTTSKKYVGGQLAYVNGPFKLYLKALTGGEPDKSSVTTLNADINFQATPKFGLGFDVTNKSIQPEKGTSANFLGTTVYANYAVSNSFVLALRGEYFDDSKNVALLNSKITAFTLSGNFKVDAFTFIPEIRIDNADKELFNGQKSDTSFILAAVYKF